MEDADIWFMRFSLDYQANTMACGNRLGRIYVWDLSSPNAQPVARLKVNGKDKQTVRRAFMPAVTKYMRTNPYWSCVQDLFA